MLNFCSTELACIVPRRRYEWIREPQQLAIDTSSHDSSSKPAVRRLQSCAHLQRALAGVRAHIDAIDAQP